MGPRMSFRLGRLRQPDAALAKEALKRARPPTDEKTKKNISVDGMGDKIGRIHVGRLDLGDLQTRKMKGLKRSRDEDLRGAEDEEEEEDSGVEEEGTKRRRK